MNRRERERFDALMEQAIDALPPGLRALIEEIPIIVEDRPDERTLREICAEHGEAYDPALGDELCGLHTGVALTERSVEDTALPDEIRLFRDGIVALAGGWDVPDADDAVYEEIMVTLLHEIGHHFGLDEDDLDELGYA
ncbi:MAG: metallopeptidase family protein [Phycisphaerales bacterium]